MTKPTTTTRGVPQHADELRSNRWRPQVPSHGCEAREGLDRHAGKVIGYWDGSHIRHGAAAQATGISLLIAKIQPLNALTASARKP